MEDKTPTGLREQQSRRKRVNKIRTSIVTGMFIWMLVVTVMLPVLLLRLFWLEDKVKELTESMVSVEQEVDNESRKSGAVSGESMEDSVKDANQIEHEIGEASAQQDGAQKEDTPKAYLTFDDGPSDNTPRILDILKEKGVKATFFVIGQEGKEAEAIYRRIVEEGHTLAMHSYSHKYNEIYASVDAFAEDMTHLQTYLAEVTGVTPTIMRFPGGSSNHVSSLPMEEFIRYTNEKGLTYFDWNVMSGDATGQAYMPEELIENVMKDAVRYQSAVVLMHDAATKAPTAEALAPMIDRLREAGFTLLPIDEDTEPVQNIEAGSVK